MAQLDLDASLGSNTFSSVAYRRTQLVSFKQAAGSNASASVAYMVQLDLDAAAKVTHLPFAYMNHK